ncbi:hypothetical protein EMGBS4_09740 [Acidimicrobiaceae bacterium]|nr:hypothetical protein EMGBS4_09740 [Acidimicrobiaceae bacterium]
MRNLQLKDALHLLLRVSVGCLPFIGAGVGELLDDRSASVQITGTTVAWVVWGAVVIASFISHPITLTVLRIGTPVVAAFIVFIAVTQGSSGSQIIGAAVGIAILLLSFSAEIGGIYVQASAYGDEKRFALRPPVVLIAPVLLSVLIADLSILGLPMLVAAKNWAVAIIALIGFFISVKYLLPRIHLLSRRWLVFVPAGIVVHDEIVLSINLMIRKQDLLQMQLARDNSAAADLSALTWGVPLELSFNKPLDVSLTAIGAKHLKAVSAIHAQSVLIAASRPGSVLNAYDTKTN